MHSAFDRRISTYRVAILIVVATSLTAVAQGQTPSPSDIEKAAQTLERQQREEQDRRRAEEAQRARENARPGVSIELPTPTATVRANATAKFKIKELKIEGASLLTRRALDQFVATYSGREIGLDDVERLLSDILKYYFAKGFGTTRAYLPDQDLSSGILRVTVIEGRIEGFVQHEAGKPDQVPSRNIFPASPGDILNLRDLERGVDNLNRIASNSAILDLIPGSKPG
jgi:hemolysin activation/secretion protein